MSVEQLVTPLRLLALVQRDLGRAEIDAHKGRAATQIAATLGLPGEPHITDSIDWYQEKFGTAGNWDSWVWETVTGRDYETRKPHFDGFVVFGDRIGKAGAAIVDLALRNAKAVIFWSDGHLAHVRGVTVVDSEDMARGWGLLLEELK